MTKPMIQRKKNRYRSSLCKEYRIVEVVIEAVKDVNLEILDGELIAIYGPSALEKPLF